MSVVRHRANGAEPSRVDAGRELSQNVQPGAQYVVSPAELLVHNGATITAGVGGLLCGLLGLRWLRQAIRFEHAAAWSTGLEVHRLEWGAYALLGSLIAAWIAAGLITQGRARTASIVLLAAGSMPGLVDPRAFIVTWLLILAGLLAVERRPPSRPRVP